MSEQQQKKPLGESDKFKFHFVYLMPILASMLFGLACAFLLIPQQSTTIPVMPIPEETPGAPVGNALYFVVLVAVAATVFYLLIKRGSKKLVKTLIIISMTTASLLLSWFYLDAIFSYFPQFRLLIIPLMIILTVVFDLAIFRFGGVVRNVAVIGVGGALGIFFGASIPWWSAVVILVFLSFYDVIAVYKGPVGKIAQSGLDDLQGLSYSFKDIQMGLGDLVFYSMLTGLMFKTFLGSIFPVIAALIGVLAGSVLTFYMLEKRGLFPGLPFPIMLGLAAGFVVALLLGLPVPPF